MYRFSESLLEQSQALFSERYNRSISLDEAQEMLARLVSLFGHLTTIKKSRGGAENG
jgi:hypothetical protein